MSARIGKNSPRGGSQSQFSRDVFGRVHLKINVYESHHLYEGRLAAKPCTDKLCVRIQPNKLQLLTKRRFYRP